MDPKDLPASAPAPAPSTRYFALLDSGDFVEVGSFDEVEAAFEAEPPDTLWLFTEQGLRSMRNHINQLLGD